MIKLLRKLATAMLPALLCGTLFIGCEADDKYTKVDDLFQPDVYKRQVVGCFVPESCSSSEQERQNKPPNKGYNNE